MILSSVCLSIDMSFDFNPPHALNKCDTLPINFIVSRQLTPKELTPIALTQLSPPSVSNPSDNLKNLFELPIIFYALVFYLFITKQVDPIYVNAAWIFFGFRTLHSLVHCTFNLIMLRFYLYLISAIALWFMTIRAFLMYVNS